MMRLSKFYAQEEKRYWSGLGGAPAVKLVAKMFREITHMKPPRGRQGRLLDQTKHFAVEARSGNYRQDIFTAEHELMLLENKGDVGYRASYQLEKGNEMDLQRLERWHKKYENKKAVSNTVNSLQDLIQGLMGLGLRGEVRYEEIGYSEKTYQATMYLDGFVITVKHTGGDDD